MDWILVRRRATGRQSTLKWYQLLTLLYNLYSKLVILCCNTQLSGDLSGLKIGLLKEGFTDCNEEVEEIVKKAAHSLTNAGAVVEEVSLPEHHEGQISANVIFDCFNLCTYMKYSISCVHANLDGGNLQQFYQ